MVCAIDIRTDLLAGFFGGQGTVLLVFRRGDDVLRIILLVEKDLVNS